MNKFFFTKCAFIIMSSAFMFSSCMEKDVYKGEPQNQPLKPSEVFDFSLTKEIKVNIDYGFTNDYYVLFQLYDQDPMKLVDNSWVKDETLNPIYAASTDTKGQYSGTITIPSSITEVWLYSEYLGTVSPVKLAVSNGVVNYNQKEYIASLQTKTRATTSHGFTYPDTYMLMPSVDWDQYGLPSNVEPDLCMPSSDILYSINATYTMVGKESIGQIHTDWLERNTTSEINISKATEVSLVFMKSGANFHNAVGYFTYKTGTIPTEDNIQKILAFPNVTKQGGGALICGHEVKLKYWNKETKKFEDKFPAGMTIGWFLEADAFRDGNIGKKYYTRYSYYSMNPEDKETGVRKQRVVALRHGSTSQIVTIGFEDNNGGDYCDATFYLKVAEASAVEGGVELPPASPPTDNKNFVIYEGTLTYEDQWPSEGDYDMNDVVLKYHSTLYRKTKDNSVYKIVNEFTPIHNGGTYTCGFGYQLHNIELSAIKSIDFSDPSSSRYESGQSHPTIILFDELKSALNKTFTVTLELNDTPETQVAPPYNPFIFVNGRGKEVHLVNYPPTSKADFTLFNTDKDVSNPSERIYYLTRYNEDDLTLMPFGINLPGITDFNIPVEGVRIYKTYPRFIEWVKSKGENNTDWYK